VAARGNFVIWTDDDVEVDAGWLSAYLDAFERHPNASLFGGRAVPRYEDPQRPWFIRAAVHLQSMLAVRDFPHWTTITPKQLPYGLNYAVRSAEQRRHLYDPELGVAPGRRRGGEETAVVEAILAEGGTGVWVWDALVHHLIPARRQTIRYIFEFYRAHGHDFPVISLDGNPRGAMPRLVALVLRRSIAAGAKSIVREPSWVRSVVELARTLGTIDRVRSG
jgi:glucosyl-dolichyl phosphate glucuronosyltransferase